MSISAAQLITQAASADNVAPAGRSVAASVPAGAPTGASPSVSPAPVVPESAFSTDMKVDEQHRVYYEFVDGRTGDVMFEIPPAALRAIGESLNVPLVGDASVPSVDVKS